ncbi:ROK family protein [Aureimonas leprariae]|uniref:ROK family protein n=1 Tax=Plantimonas leprariae TaxID=2615207 RepID=A0A7V7PM49_9HYPH|nr:ROK family protein [Aureimonas leprariae]KAB0677744.1 ROK family protein [Aureimonas leprariae]
MGEATNHSGASDAALSLGRGRPAICADIGGSFIKAARLDGDGAFRNEVRMPTPAKDWPAFRDAMRGLFDAAPEAEALSLSIAGVFDPDTGLAVVANIPCIHGRRLAADLEAAIGRPVLVANDADCFALAEALRGAGVGYRNVFGIILGTGIGGGLVVNGRIVAGAGGVAGEWGHGPVIRPQDGCVGPEGFPAYRCGCGQVGCVDTMGARGLERLDRHLNGVERDSRALVDAWVAGEPAATRTVELWINLVSGPLSIVVNVTGAAVLPAGGGLSNSAPLLAALDAALRRRILRRADAPLIRQARIGADAGLVGAALHWRTEAVAAV